MDEPEARFSGRVGGGGGRRIAAALVIVFASVVVIGVLGRSAPDAGPPTGGSQLPSTPPTMSPPPSVPVVHPACDPLPADSPVPTLRLGSDGDPIGVHGYVGATHRPGAVVLGKGWQVPPLDYALRLGVDDRPRLILGTGDCLVDLVIEVAPAGLDHAPSDAERTTLVAQAVEPWIFEVTMFPWWTPGDPNDWVIRVVATYSTGELDPDPAEAVWAEQFFRVVSESAPDASVGPIPAVTPAVPCKFFVASGGVGARLFIPGGAPVYGPPDAAFAPTVRVDTTAELEIGLDGDGCAIEWTLTAVNPLTLEELVAFEAVVNEGGDPGHAAQDRWRLHAVPGASLLHLRYRSTAEGEWLDAWWHLVAGE